MQITRIGVNYEIFVASDSLDKTLNDFKRNPRVVYKFSVRELKVQDKNNYGHNSISDTFVRDKIMNDIKSSLTIIGMKSFVFEWEKHNF